MKNIFSDVRQIHVEERFPMQTVKTGIEDRLHMLKVCPMFRPMQPEELRLFAGGLVLKRYDPGEFLIYQDDQAAAMFVIVKGTARILRIGADGREQILHIAGTGDTIGEVPMFQGEQYPASAMASGEVEVLTVSREDFLSLGRRHPEMLFGILRIMASRLRRFVELIDDLSLKEVPARLAKFLLDQSLRSGDIEVRLATTKAVLAGRLGATPETLSRALRKMENAGIIEVHGRSISLLSRDRLMEVAAGVRT